MRTAYTISLGSKPGSSTAGKENALSLNNYTFGAVRKRLRVCFCTWSCDFSFLDELVVWKVLDDLLCDFPRVDFHPLRLQHLQHHKVTNMNVINV